MRRCFSLRYMNINYNYSDENETYGNKLHIIHEIVPPYLCLFDSFNLLNTVCYTRITAM